MKRSACIILLLLLLNSAYLAGFPAPTVFYMANALLHVVLGLALVIVWRQIPFFPVLLCAAAAGMYLAVAGNTRPHAPALYAHVAVAVVSVLLIAWKVKSKQLRAGLLGGLAMLALAPGANRILREERRIRNPLVVPASMEEEAHGASSPFFPSSSTTNTGAIIPANFFMDSEACGRCHKDIYEQWKSSVHHFASFNNQFYRKSIEYMQDVVGPQPSKWCAGCHDHAVFFNGRFETPIKQQIDTPEARAGLACTSCHAITHVQGSMGQGGFTIEYPALHELMSSKNTYVRAMDRFMTYLDPEPHRRTFMKPFMTADSPEFCS